MEPFREVTDTDAIMAYIFDRNKSFIGSGSAPSRSGAPPDSQAAAAEAAVSDPVWLVHAACNAKEASAVAAAESGDLDKAQAILDALCAEHATRASAFNNRAQLKRMRGDAAGGKEDLDTAIRLGQDWLSRNDFEGSSPRSDSASAAPTAAPASAEDVMHTATRVKLIAFTRRVLQQSLLQRAAYWRYVKIATLRCRRLHKDSRHFLLFAYLLAVLFACTPLVRNALQVTGRQRSRACRSRGSSTVWQHAC